MLKYIGILNGKGDYVSTKKIVIYGTGAWGRQALLNVEKYKDIELTGFADSNKTGEIYGYPIVEFENEVCREFAVVIAIATPKDVLVVYRKLRSIGIKKIYWFLNKTKCFGNDFFACECVQCGDNFGEELPHAELHLVDFCNLNCKGCTHFSPLFDRQIPNTNARLRDVENVKRIFSKIHILSLMGGEPLLNPDVQKYIEQTRKILPDSAIQLVTNGLLLLQIDKKVLQYIKSQNVQVIISECEPTHKIIDKIVELLEHYEIDYTIRPYEKKQGFCKPLSLKTDSIYERKCISNGCVQIWEGKMACCPTLMYIHKFNEKFNQNLPQEGIYDISYLQECGKDLLSKLYDRVPLCDYCVENTIMWERCSADPKIEDFSSFE